MLVDLLKIRYSCRNFLDKDIPEELIKYIVECGRLSTSGGNEQPWKFGIITNKELIKNISLAASVNYFQEWISKSPLIIVLCTKLFNLQNDKEIGMGRFPSFHDKLQKIDRELYSRIDMEEHQTKIAGEHMVLAALEHGIFSTWVSSIDCEKVGKLIGLNDYIVSNIIVFGYPKGDSTPTIKKDIKNITFLDSFQKLNIYDFKSRGEV